MSFEKLYTMMNYITVHKHFTFLDINTNCLEAANVMERKCSINISCVKLTKYFAGSLLANLVIHIVHGQKVCDVSWHDILSYCPAVIQIIQKLCSIITFMNFTKEDLKSHYMQFSPSSVLILFIYIIIFILRLKMHIKYPTIC